MREFVSIGARGEGLEVAVGIGMAVRDVQGRWWHAAGLTLTGLNEEFFR